MHFKPVVHEGIEGRLEITFDKKSPLLLELLRLIVLCERKCVIRHRDFVLPCRYNGDCRKSCIVADELRELRQQIAGIPGKK